jgi:hypothetical protein
MNFAIKANVVTTYLDANSVAYTSGSLGTTALQPASADPELVVSLRTANAAYQKAHSGCDAQASPCQTRPH